MGATQISVVAAGGWAVGDQISIAPSFSNAAEHEIVTITAISGTTVTFTPALQYNHYGASGATITKSMGTLDTRSAVGHVTRRIRFISGSDSGWGYRVHVFGYMDTYFDEGLQQDVDVPRVGTVTLKGVEFYEGGQYDTEFATLRFDMSSGDDTKTITKSSFHACKSYCMYIDDSLHMSITNNVFYNGRLFHVRAIGIQDFTFNNNLMIAATKRPTFTGKELVACFATWNAIHEDSVTISNNLCQGSSMHGFVFPKIPCANLDSPPYFENTAGSTDTAFIFNKISGACLGVTGVKAYASKIAQISSSQGPEKVIYQNFMVADCLRGATLRFGLEGADRTAEFKNSYITAISRPTCTSCYGETAIKCSGGQGIRMLAITVNGEAMPDKFGSGFDVICKQ